ncbi:MAG TPA: DNA polymerase III subunit gamma/tau C-terminal domain-containing protein [Burkholderiaceae bacterium]|nr:DNA polymerase III subunit gamma/tau C-terminal domain-containing protein [Burkholderiaceae bacterium]
MDDRGPAPVAQSTISRATTDGSPPSGNDQPSDTAPDDGPPESWYEDAGFAPDDTGFTPSDDPDEFETLAPDVERAMGAMPGRSQAEQASPSLRAMTPDAWPALAASLPLTGLAAELARQSEWLEADDHRIALRVAVRSLVETHGRARLRTVLSEHFGTAVQLDIECGATGDATAHAVAQARSEALQRQAEQDVDADPFVRSLIDEFGGTIIPGSVRAVPDDKAA